MIATQIHRALAAAGTGLCLSLVLHSPVADAATQRTINLSATSVCEAPLPVYNVQLRKRPVAVQNESDSSVFVTCTLPTDDYGHSNTGTVEVTFASFDGAAANIGCTMVSGTRGAQVFYVSQERSLAASGRVSMTWENINKWSSGMYAFSCNLPSGVAMETITYTQTDTSGRV